MNNSTECIFCKIISGQIPAAVIYNDDCCLAFLDHMPINKGHVLIVPKIHVASFSELEKHLGGQIFYLAQRISIVLHRNPILCHGINLFLTDGKDAGQEVFHTHLHIIPRFSGDGFGLKFGKNQGKIANKEQLGDFAIQITESLQSMLTK